MTDHRFARALACLLFAVSACTTTVSELPVVTGGEIGSGLPGVSSARSTPTTKAPTGPVSLERKQACTIVDESVIAKVGVPGAEPGPARNNWGSTCSYVYEDIYIFALLTDGPSQGIGQVSPNKGAQVSMRKIGAFSVRQEVYPKVCALAVALTPGRALLVRYSDARDDAQHRCRQVETLVTEAIARLEHS